VRAPRLSGLGYFSGGAFFRIIAQTSTATLDSDKIPTYRYHAELTSRGAPLGISTDAAPYVTDSLTGFDVT
jgi:hypothetical protein